MNYYKVIKNGTVIDVNFAFLKYQPRNRILVGCRAEEANFIQSSDMTKVWRVKWLKPVGKEAGEYETVEAVEITESEYLSLKSQLEDGAEVTTQKEPEPEAEAEPIIEMETPAAEVMSVGQMRRKIARLEEQVQCLLQLNGLGGEKREGD